MNRKLTTKNDQESHQLGMELAKELGQGGVLCLYGDLGAGKTTFTQGLAKALGIDQKVSSPTFVLMREYAFGDSKKLYHIDLYRLESLLEAKSIGIVEILQNNNNVVVIEWPEKVESLLPKNRWEVRIVSTGPETREILIEHIEEKDI